MEYRVFRETLAARCRVNSHSIPVARILPRTTTGLRGGRTGSWMHHKNIVYAYRGENDVIEGVENKGSWAFSKHVGAACLAFFLTCLPASAEKALTVPAAKTEELFSVQRTMVEAWTIIQDAFVDQTFNHTNWENELERHLIAVSRAQTRDQGINELKSLISDLHDPYTRWVSADEYRDFRVDTEGEIGGVGLLIANDPTTGRLLVLAPIAGSPAAKAGIHPGDELISINGSAIQGLDNEATAAQLRGSSGSSVDVEIARVTGAVPGEVGGKMTEESRLQRKKFRLKRERVQLSPIFATAVHTSDDHTYGYIRLVNFSQKASEEMRKAVTQLVKDGSEGFIVDLRNNPGGLVSSALDVASLWMDGEQRPTVFSIESKDSEPQSVKLFGTHALTDLPLTVLVNGQSASASEILAGALKDSNRGDVIGETTFGKGKIQSVFELSDGSALFVTVATYVTPNGTRIDREGIHPSFSCSLEAGTPRTSAGIPIAPGLVGTDSDIMEELENDACVKTAESDLSRRISSTATSRMTTM